MPRRAATTPKTRRERDAFDSATRTSLRGAAAEIVTVSRRGDELLFDRAEIAAQLGVRADHVRIRKDLRGGMTVEVFRPMSDLRLGYWESYEAQLLG